MLVIVSAMINAAAINAAAINAAAINAAAHDLYSRGISLWPGLGDQRVWICDVVDALLAQNAGWTEEQVKATIGASCREVCLGTPDLLGSYDMGKLRRSLVQTPDRPQGEKVCFVYAL